MELKKLKKKDSPIIMGILNITPDSFSDGGRYNSVQAATKRAMEMEEQGADIIDIGGESTGPGSKKVKTEEEIRRILPVLKAIRGKTRLPLSIDTYKAEVARAALGEGADMINDVTALREDNKMAEVITDYKCPIVLMYSKDPTPRTTRRKKRYKNVIAHIKNFLEERMRFAQEKGIRKSQIIVDPGMGAFVSAIPKYSYEVIANLREFQELSAPILIGVSRKSFLKDPCERTARARSEGEESGFASSELSELYRINERDCKSAVLSAIAYINGASIIRTHNVKETLSCLNWK